MLKNIMTLKMFKKADFENIANLNKTKNEDKTQFDLRKFFAPAKEAMVRVMAERMDILGSSNKI